MHRGQSGEVVVQTGWYLRVVRVVQVAACQKAAMLKGCLLTLAVEMSVMERRKHFALQENSVGFELAGQER